MAEFIFADLDTLVRVFQTAVNERACRVRLVDPPMVSDDPVSYCPGQVVSLSERGARKLFDTFKEIYEPKHALMEARTRQLANLVRELCVDDGCECGAHACTKCKAYYFANQLLGITPACGCGEDGCSEVEASA